MATILNPPPSNNAISVFAYERFNFVISNPNTVVYTLQPVSNTTGFGVSPSPLYFTKNGNSNITFAISDLSNNLTPGTTESFRVTVTDACLNSLVSSNTVTINAGRFLDPSGVTLSNNSYTFFKNEAITPIQLVAPSFTLATPTSIPALPPGLSFSNVASNIFAIRGTPLVPVANSNYQIIGVQSGGSKIVTTRFNMVISNERLRVDLSGAPIIGGMEVGTAITPRVITSIPPATGGSVRYTYPAFPDGIVVKDSLGTVQSGTSFVPALTDPSYTMIIEGTPTIAAAEAFRTAGAGSNGLPYTVTATRFTPLPALSNTIPLTFQFGETVLFDTPTLDPVLYVGVPVNMTRNFFRAQTYFTSIVGISNIFSTNLRTDLSLIYTPGSDRADLSGTPLSAGTATYTIRAINSNAKQRDLSATISVVNDTISFESPTPIADACYSFILSRPLTLIKPGYYESNIQFKATAASQLPVTLSAPALAGTGLSLDASGVIVGLPSQVTPLTTLAVTANAVGSPATATRNIKFSILADTFEFTDVSASKLSFIENIPITPVRFPATTLSERNIIGYSQSGFPPGISINSAGVISGTPTSATPSAGNATITATTGYASGSRDFSYSIIPDNLLLTAPQSFYSYVAGDPVSIQITGTSYSGATVSNYGITLPAPYGLAIGNTSGLISGTWTDSIPPNQLLPASLTFNLTGEVGDTTASSPVSLTASPIIQNTSFVWASQRLYSSNPTSSWLPNSNVLYPYTPVGFDIVIKNSNVDGNFILATASNSIYRSTNANDFSKVLLGGAGNSNQLISSLAFDPITTTWWASGTRVHSDAVRRPNILQSDDDGLTWYPLTTLKSTTEMMARDSNASGGVNPYLLGGIALKYADGVMMAGGLTDGMGNAVMLRSTDYGVSWSDVIGGFTNETAYFNLEVSNMWIATGSSGYKSLDVPQVYSSPTDTIKYSTNAGQRWSNATGGFNMFGYELIYANNTWVASGVDGSGSTPFTASLKYSTDGINWSNVSGVPSVDVSSAFIPVNNPAPYPIATYDFNFYSSGASTISNQVQPSSIDSASISLPTVNTYVTTDPINKYLTIYAPNNFPSLTGGITTPSIGGVYSVEMWVRMDNNGPYGMYFVDFRTGQSDGYIIGAGGGGAGAVGPAWVGQTVYYNKISETILSTHNPVTSLYNQGWKQVVLVSSTPFTDDMTFFARFTNQQGMPLSVGEISIYDSVLTSQDVEALYNQKCLRYGLVPPQQLSETIAPLRIGSMNYDGSNWNVFRRQKDASNNWTSTLYSSSDITSGSWTTTNVTSTFSNTTVDGDKRFISYTRPQYLRPSDSRTIEILLSFAGAIGGGPTISPSSSGFLLYQYVAMSLQLSAVGTGTIYFFISSAELPPGLTFDPITNIISGSPAQDGTFTTRVYAKDDNGVSLVTYTFTVNIPRIIRRQDGAGAYTSLLKQYTEVLAAQSARDSRALPAQEAHLGEFMAPVPVAVTTKTFSTNCQNCLRQECPASNLVVDANGSSSVVCAFIDANEGEVFDAGNAGGNICD